MLYFQNDYHAGCHAEILRRLDRLSQRDFPGYGQDELCGKAADTIRRLCGREDLAVHFLVGGTQTNLTVIAAALRPYQAVIAAQSGHIHVHETGAVEATGHKVLALPSQDGKVTAAQVEQLMESHQSQEDPAHEVQPKMVYISYPTELGTLYTRQELEALHRVCRQYGLYLFLDGARLGYGLTAKDCDVTLQDLARLCDVFYIGGTKVGAMFGEAVVIANPELAGDFRYMIKRQGGMLAKGWLLGLQFEALLEDGLYFRIAQKANDQADRIRKTLEEAAIPVLVPGSTNQIFPILPVSALKTLSQKVLYTDMGPVDETHRAIRLCTSWSTGDEAVEELCRLLEAAKK